VHAGTRGHLDDECAGATGPAGDEQALACSHANAAERLASSEPAHRKRGSGGSVQAARPPCHMRGVNEHLLRPETAAAGQWRLMGEHGVTDCYVAHVHADGEDPAGAFDPKCGGRTQPDVPAAALQQSIPPANAGGFDGDHDLAGSGLRRVRQFQQPDLTAELADSARTHIRSERPCSFARGGVGVATLLRGIAGESWVVGNLGDVGDACLAQPVTEGRGLKIRAERGAEWLSTRAA
jgi:hypothetical protein